MRVCGTPFVIRHSSFLTMDTKGEEHGFVAELIRKRGHQALIVDVGIAAPPQIPPDVSREEVARIAQLDLAALVAGNDRGAAVLAMSKAAPVVLSKLYAE